MSQNLPASSEALKLQQIKSNEAVASFQYPSIERNKEKEIESRLVLREKILRHDPNDDVRPDESKSSQMETTLETPSFVGPADAIRLFFTLPYRSEAISLAIHRMGDTLLVDASVGGRESESLPDSTFLQQVTYIFLVREKASFIYVFLGSF